METSNNRSIGIVVAVAIALVSLVLSLIGFSVNKSTVSDELGGQRAGLQEFVDGLKSGDITSKGVTVTIAAGANQASWLNNTGRTVFINPNDVSIRFESGTASSSLKLFVGTSTSASFTDYARPTPPTLLMDGANFATSTTAGVASTIRVGTTTSTGIGFGVPSGSYVVFDIQEQFACKTIGACETATSSNRGVTNFTGQFRYTY